VSPVYLFYRRAVTGVEHRACEVNLADTARLIVNVRNHVGYVAILTIVTKLRGSLAPHHL